MRSVVKSAPVLPIDEDIFTKRKQGRRYLTYVFFAFSGGNLYLLKQLKTKNFGVTCSIFPLLVDITPV